MSQTSLATFVTRSAVLLLALAWPFRAEAQASGSGGTVQRSGTVAARTLVREPSDDPSKKGAPIFAEFDFTQKDPAKRIVVIGAAKGKYENAEVMSAERYKALVQHAEDFKQANEQGKARGATYITSDEYKTRDFVTTDGQPVIKPPLSADVRSVLVRGADTLRAPNTEIVLLSFTLDLTDQKDLDDTIRGVLIDKTGRVVYQSRTNIGYRTAFYKPSDLNLDFVHDASRDDPANGRAPGDELLAPVREVRVETAGGATVTDGKGRFTLSYNVPGCEGHTISYPRTFSALIPYRQFDSTGKEQPGTYPVSKDDAYACSGTSAVQGAGSVPLDFRIDVAVLNGRA